MSFQAASDAAIASVLLRKTLVAALVELVIVDQFGIGQLKLGQTVEATSGNTGYGIEMGARKRAIPLVVTTGASSGSSAVSS